MSLTRHNILDPKAKISWRAALWPCLVYNNIDFGHFSYINYELQVRNKSN